jgi:hypothetical protein
MKRILVLGLLVLMSGMTLAAQIVDKDEFTDIVAKTINFVNFNGAYARIDTLDQILAIGRTLAQGVVKERDSAGSYGDRYLIRHVLGTPAEPGKPADILVLTEKAGVDHIDNIRRIISSYLMAGYAYAKADADILAVFITVYNAVHRGNMTFFQGRYKSSVMSHLSADKVGLSIRYSDWPGKTQILIPLNLGAVTNGKPGSLAVVSAKDLVTPEVVETIRDKPDAGTKERQQLADLMDRTVDQTQNAIDQQKADLAKQQQQVDQKLAQVNQQIAQTTSISDGAKTPDKAAADGGKSPQASPVPDASRPTTDASRPAAGPAPDAGAVAATDNASPAQSLQAEKQQLEAQKAQLQDQQKQLDQQQAANTELAQASQALRDSTAKDLKNQGQTNAEANTPVVALRNRLEKGLILGQAIRVIPASSEVLGQSQSTGLVGRQLQPFGDSLLGIDYDGTNASLVLLSAADLSLVKKGATVISPYSELVQLPGGSECLAVMQQDGEWYLGRFDAQLNSVARSAIPVDPVGAVTVKDGTVLVQRKDGRITSLNLADLRTGN